VNLTFLPLAEGVCGDEVIDTGEDCDDGNTFGGDGCAQNCTDETERLFRLDPSRSKARTQFSSQLVELSMSGHLAFVTGRANDDGSIPFAIPSALVDFGRIQVPGVACACVRSIDQPERFGPGNAGIGAIGCGDSFFVSSIAVTRDHNIGVVGQCLRGNNEGEACDSDADCPLGQCFNETRCIKAQGTVEPPDGLHPGVCNGPKQLTLSPDGPRGSIAIETNIGFDLLFDGGTCCDVGIDPGCTDPTGQKGPDGIACTEDDPGLTRGLDVPGLTGPSSTSIVDLNNVPDTTLGPGSMCGAAPCAAEIQGELFDCDAILTNPTGGLDTGVIALAFQIFDYPGFGDSLVTVTLAPLPQEAGCTGDCNFSGSVTIDELVRGVNIALGTSTVDVCVSLDRDLSGTVTIDELVTAVGNALNGCQTS